MTKFSDLALDPRVTKAVAEAGYETPTPIQAQAIPPALEGRDVLGIAQTGTGKTASFTLPMITRLGRGRARARMPRSLVLCPTRELAAQVAENFDTYAKHTRLTKALLIGGVSFGEQDKLIDRGVDVLIATPGRLLDHFERGKLLLTGVEIMVVDEADRMLDMGFIPDIERIFQLTPFTRQTLFFSATMAPEIERITNAFLSAPVKIEVARQNSTSDTIEQALIQITPTRKDRTFADKRAVLRALIQAEGEACTNAIIFCNRKIDVDVVAKSLKSHGFNASPIHGDLEQSQRMKTLDGFRDGSVHLLVASDVAARGLDIPAVSHVFNFDVPTHPEDYVHRIGRTGRAGRKGKAFTIAVPADGKYLAQIESLVKKEIPRGALPEGFELVEGGRPDRKGDDRKPARGGRGGKRHEDRRGRDRREDPLEEAAEAAEARAAHPVPASVEPAQAETRAEPRRDDRREDRREDRHAERASETAREPRRDDRREDRRDDRKDGRREDRRDDRRDHRRRDDRGDNVVGMGDHVPDFILRSFRLASPANTDADTEDEAAEG
ncbi:DEAD/DEAH box helicase [Aliigemmobacter aestuarii]|uniref:DEAD-box ATP-dependent RNA helicase RhpA n=1 Tax=Aliigemmobacter aestuarii TaxID=1445661 RepID=A0A4S3ML90_9RHOB|nr:DEAD/DEAH box helicase [Gemmobacter aestuarii]THD82847.1 DEAD/DEAH box helicase [Gemmobacter aestuarii]